MKYYVSKLIKEHKTEFDVNEEVDFSEAVKRNPDIRRMGKVSITGKGLLNATAKTVDFRLHIKGEMILPCALTLDDVVYPFEADIHPRFIWDALRYDEDSDDILVKDAIELAPAVWQEIFIQIPLRVVKRGAHEELARQGIEILSEEELEKERQNKVDPRFSVLEKLKFDE